MLIVKRLCTSEEPEVQHIEIGRIRSLVRHFDVPTKALPFFSNIYVINIHIAWGVIMFHLDCPLLPYRGNDFLRNELPVNISVDGNRLRLKCLLEFLFAANISMNGQKPILPSKTHSPLSSRRGRAIATKIMTFGVYLEDLQKRSGSGSSFPK